MDEDKLKEMILKQANAQANPEQPEADSALKELQAELNKLSILHCIIFK